MVEHGRGNNKSGEGHLLVAFHGTINKYPG
jgi:hypothetical protein